MNMTPLEKMTAVLTFERIIGTVATNRRLSEDEIIAILESKMQPSVDLVESLESDVSKIEYYRAHNLEQFELLKNNPGLVEIAKNYTEGVVHNSLMANIKDTVEWVNDPEFTNELYMKLLSS